MMCQLASLLGIRCLAPKPPDDASSPPQPPPDAPLGLLTLPADVLLLVCARLPLQSLSYMAMLCSTAAERLPAEAWRTPLVRCRLRAFAALGRLAPPRTRQLMSNEAFLMNKSESQAELPSDDETDELVVWCRAADAALANAPGASSLHVLCSTLRPLLCSVCDAGPATVSRFWATDRGACELCFSARPVEAQAWKRLQRRREAAEIARRDHQSRDLLEACVADHLPVGLRSPLTSFRLAFSSDRHGGSATALLRAARGVPASLLVVTERRPAPLPRIQQRVFGAFIPTAWPLTSANRRRPWFGDSRAFLFSLSPERRVHAATGHDEHFAHVSSDGIGFGGDIGGSGHALFLSSDLSEGRCLPSRTFGDTSRLASGVRFLVDTVQLWDVCDDPMARGRARAQWEAGDDESILKPGQDQLMLEFVGVERDIAVLRRFNG
jgi:hypothetical protein